MFDLLKKMPKKMRKYMMLNGMKRNDWTEPLGLYSATAPEEQ
jgi:hypothetical protein